MQNNKKSKTYLQKAEKNLFEQGLTSINDAGVNHKERELFIELFKFQIQLLVNDIIITIFTFSSINANKLA